jgi:hypothetical protein
MSDYEKQVQARFSGITKKYEEKEPAPVKKKAAPVKKKRKAVTKALKAITYGNTIIGYEAETAGNVRSRPAPATPVCVLRNTKFEMGMQNGMLDITLDLTVSSNALDDAEGLGDALKYEFVKLLKGRR